MSLLDWQLDEDKKKYGVIAKFTDEELSEIKEINETIEKMAQVFTDVSGELRIAKNKGARWWRAAFEKYEISDVDPKLEYIVDKRTGEIIAKPKRRSS